MLKKIFNAIIRKKAVPNATAPAAVTPPVKFVQVSPLPIELRGYITQKGSNKKGLCYHNCLIAVIDKAKDEALDLRYVLGWVTNEDEGLRVQHAWLCSNGNYYDPTLEVRGLVEKCTYEVEHVLSVKDVFGLMRQQFDRETISEMLYGRLPYPPLCILNNGLVGFDENAPG